LESVVVGDADRAGAAEVPDEREEALQREQHTAALALVPRDVADVVVALPLVDVGRDHVRVPCLLGETRVRAIEAAEDAVEVQAPMLVRGDALEVLQRHE